jgi:hypothetical protein
MIARLTAENLRRLADQVDAYTALVAADGTRPAPNTTLTIDGDPFAYLAWWEDGAQYLAELISFTPGDATPLIWHEGPS